MGKILYYSRAFVTAGVIGVFLISFFSCPALGQTFPSKPITAYCGFAAGASVDVTARALARGAEKQLGVPIVVENKPGGGATVGAALLASKKPDGYTLGITSTGALTIRPHVLKLSYDPLKDFTLIMQYTLSIGGLCVLSSSPIKTIEDFIAYAKANPGLSYGSPGVHNAEHLAVETLAQRKGLMFKHIPTKGGSEANTMLLGHHTDFVAGAGQHINYIKQGTFRMLVLLHAEKRDPNFPDIPTLKELGCEDAPSVGYIVMGPKGMPDPICKKLGDAFKKVSETADFKKLLASFHLPYVYKDREQLEKIVPADFEIYRSILEKMGVKKQS